MSQGTSLYSYLKQKKRVIFYSFFYRIGGQEGRTGTALGGWYQWKQGGGREKA
jgi:hypothetical protein